MMKKALSILSLFVILFVSGCARTGSESRTENDAEVLTSEYSDQETSLGNEGREFDVRPGEHGYLGVQWIEHMNDYLPNRLAFTDRELETAEWIVETLLEMGFDEDQVEMQTFAYNVPTSSWWGDPTRMIQLYEATGYYDGLERLDESQNVILTLPGRSAETIIIGAHYDGVGYPGISDNAGGVVLLLENAYRMRDIDHYYTLQYVFFGAEEVGLVGAFYFVDNMTQEEIDNLVLMINVDVIMDGPQLIYSVGYFEELPEIPMDIMRGEADWERRGIELLQNDVTMEIKTIAARLNAENRTDLISIPQGIALSTDQLAFLQFGIPTMVFYGTHPVDSPEVVPDVVSVIPDLFIGDVLHTERDCLDFLMETHPGRVEHALNYFGIFLEEVVSSEFVQ